MQFGDGVALHMRSDSDKALLLADLHRRFNLRVPDSLLSRRSHWNPRIARDLRAGRCVAMINARSLMQCYLYVARVEGIGEITALIDRQVRDGHFYPRIILARFSFDANAFLGTILEAELIQLSSGQHILAVADARAVCGVNFADGSPDVTDLAGRHAAVRNLLSHHFRPNLATDMCAIRLKPRIGAADMLSLAKCMLSNSTSTVDYDIVAVVFKVSRGGHSPTTDLHVTIPPAAGTLPSNQRIEAIEDNREDDEEDYNDDSEDDDHSNYAPIEMAEEEETKVFYIRTTHMPDCYELHESPDAAAASVGCGTSGVLAGVPSLEASRFLQSIGNGKAEFVMSTKFGKWVPVIH